MSCAANELVDKFESFVREKLPQLAAQETIWFDDATQAPCGRIVLYGMGSLGRLLFAVLRRLGIGVVAVADKHLSARQNEIEGVPCVSAARACADYGSDAVFIVAIFNQTGEKAFSKIKASLEELGARQVVYFLSFLWKHAEAFLPYYSLDLPSKLLGCEAQIMRVFNALGDKQSRADYAFFVYQLSHPSPILTYPVADRDTYFPADIVELTGAEAFLDGGAFDGDTLVELARRTGGHFDSYVGIEPDPANLHALERRILSLRDQVDGHLVAKASAIGSKPGELPFKADGQLGSALDPSGTTTVPVRPLADLLDGIVPSFIKLDIEGAELDALLGARNLLTKTKPKLAVCVYHRQSHFWRIPSLMREINPSYKVFFRRHREYLDDIVAYAIPA